MCEWGTYAEVDNLLAFGGQMHRRTWKIDECIAIGPAVMMKYTALLTKKYNIPTQASLNAVMVDGTGMCGACRVSVGGSTRFTCIDGPEFDAHKIDFDELILRLGGYKGEEKEAFERYLQLQKS